MSVKQAYSTTPVIVLLSALTGMAAVTISLHQFRSAHSRESAAMPAAAPFVQDSQSVQRLARRLKMFGPTPEAPRIRHRHLRPTTEAHEIAPMPRAHLDRG